MECKSLLTSSQPLVPRFRPTSPPLSVAIQAAQETTLIHGSDPNVKLIWSANKKPNKIEPGAMQVQGNHCTCSSINKNCWKGGKKTQGTIRKYECSHLGKKGVLHKPEDCFSRQQHKQASRRMGGLQTCKHMSTLGLICLTTQWSLSELSLQICRAVMTQRSTLQE